MRPNSLILLVPGARIELAQVQAPRDFKSLASTSSAIQAMLLIVESFLYSYVLL